MQTHRNLIRCTMMAAAIALALSACGGDDDDDTSAATTVATVTTTATVAAAATGAGDSSYCDIAQEWAGHELIPYDINDPAAVEKYMGEWVAFVEQAASEAPDEIRADWATSKEGITEQLVPLMAKYGYSSERFESEATADEQAFLDSPPDDIQTAQAQIHAYEGDVCATAEPEAADVEFDGPADAAYCDAVVAEDDFVHQVSPDDAAAVRDGLNSDEYQALDQALTDTVPDVLRDDVAALDQFDKDKWIPLMEKYDYSLVDVFTDGTTEEIAVINHRDDEISDAFARVLAYEQQLCGIESDTE